MALKTDYKDYIPPSGGRKYKITANSDGSSSVEDITQYQQVGDTWGAEDINQVNKLVNGAVYPNLLDNSDFTNPVNQRGVSGTITTAGYFIDRWKLVSGSVTLSADGLQLAAGTVIAQILEYAAGTDVIASLGITSGTASAAYDNATKTYTITATTACTLIWAKLEKGSIATPYVPKGYGAELAECMRYFEIAKMGFTYSQLPSNYLCTTSFKVQKRTIPTVTVVAGSIKNLYESLIDTSVTAVSTTRDSIVSVALSQTVLNNQAITLTAVLSADL